MPLPAPALILANLGQKWERLAPPAAAAHATRAAVEELARHVAIVAGQPTVTAAVLSDESVSAFTGTVLLRYHPAR